MTSIFRAGLALSSRKGTACVKGSREEESGSVTCRFAAWGSEMRRGAEVARKPPTELGLRATGKSGIRLTATNPTSGLF